MRTVAAQSINTFRDRFLHSTFGRHPGLNLDCSSPIRFLTPFFILTSYMNRNDYSYWKPFIQGPMSNYKSPTPSRPPPSFPPRIAATQLASSYASPCRARSGLTPPHNMACRAHLTSTSTWHHMHDHQRWSGMAGF